MPPGRELAYLSARAIAGIAHLPDQGRNLQPMNGQRIIWQYWETSGAKPRFIDGLHEIAKANSRVNIVLVTPETLRDYLPDIEPDIERISELAHKADMIRSRLVMRYGGMWLDSDAVVLRDLNWLFEYLEDYDFVGFNNHGTLHVDRPFVRVNCFLSRPAGRIVSAWAAAQRAKLPRTSFHWSEIGAELLNSVCLDHRPLAKILPFELICPVPWRQVELFFAADDQHAEKILEECFIVMLTNTAVRTKLPRLQRMTVEEIASENHLIGRIMTGAISRVAGASLRRPA